MSAYVYEAGDLAILTLEVPEGDATTTAGVTAWTNPAGAAASLPTATGSPDGKLWEAVAPVPTAGEWTATWTVSGAGAAKRSYTVQVSAPPPSPARTYATTGDYAEWLRPKAPPAGSARLLAAATRVVDRNTRTAVYDVTGTDEMPTDATVRQAMREAVCAQVEAWQANGTGPAGVGAGQWSSMTAGRVSLTRAAGAPAGPSGQELAAEARAILDAAGLIGHPWPA